MAQPAILMGPSLRDLNQWIVLEPPTELFSDGDCPEGKQVPLRLRRRGYPGESDVTLVLPNEALGTLARLLRKFLPED